MALKYGRTKNTTTPTPTYGLEGLKRDESVSLTNPKNLDENGRVQMYPKPASRLAGEQIVAEQDKAYRGYLSQKTEAESEYKKGTSKYGEDMKKYNKNPMNFGGRMMDEGFVPISKENLALFNDVQSRSGTGELPKSQVKLYKGTEAKFIADMQKHDKLGENDTYGKTPLSGSNYFGVAYFDKDVKPVKPLMRKVASVNAPTELEPWNLAVNPIEKIKAKGGKLKQMKAAPEKAGFNAPEKIIETVNKKSMMGGAYTKGHAKRAIGQAAEEAGDVIGNAFRNPNRRYAKEEKGFKAMYGGGVNTGDVGFSDLSMDEMKSYKKDLKQVKKGSPEFRGEVRSTIKDINAASKFKKQSDANKNVFFRDKAYGSGGVELTNTSKGTGSLGRQYQASSDFGVDRQLASMANKNTVDKQKAALSGNASYIVDKSPMAQAKAALRTANPDMSNKEVRQGAKKQRVEDKNIMKIQSEKMKNNK